MRTVFSTIGLGFVALAVSGCGLGTSAPSTPATVAIGDIIGQAHGGRQPISGGHMFLLAVGTSGYKTISSSLLTAGSNTTKDTSSGPTHGFYYVTTDANGNFSLSGDYTCTEGQAVYIYSQGGNPGSGVNNSAIGLMAVLGICPSSGSLAAQVPYVNINEASTIAAAYGLASFATDAVHISSPSSGPAIQGVTNAANNAGLIYNVVSGGQASAVTPNGYGLVPIETTSALANSLASCVNSISGTSVQCNQLFGAATSTDAPGGVLPTETATAAINIAHHPGSNVATIYNLPSGIGSPFLPTLTSQPNDFAIAILYTGGGFANPIQVAIDANANVFVKNNNGGLVILTPLGAPLAGSPFAGPSGSQNGGLAISPLGDAWVSDYKSNTLSEYNASGSAMTGSPFSFSGQLSGPSGIGFDASGNGYVTNQSNNTVIKFTSSGGVTSVFANAFTPFSRPGPLALDDAGYFWVGNETGDTIGRYDPTAGTQELSETAHKPTALATDVSNNIWGVSGSKNIVAAYTPDGNLVTGAPFRGGGLDTPSGIAIDGDGNAFVANYDGNSLTTIAKNTVTSPSNGFTAGGFVLGPLGIAVDGSGDVWVANNNTSTTGGKGNAMLEFIGFAAPLHTPLLPGNIGTRP